MDEQKKKTAEDYKQEYLNLEERVENFKYNAQSKFFVSSQVIYENLPKPSTKNAIAFIYDYDE